jgi:hypothetical protein
MSYFIFDMDETLGEMYPMFYFISSLTENIPKDGKIFYDNAYNIFVKNLLSLELSSEPLGVLRPGIFKVMDRLAALKKQGKVKDVVIYSNNGHPESVRFMRDIINAKVGDLVRECIDWNHPMRDEERLKQPGAAHKTWNVLKKILVEGNCKASSDLEAKNIYFFDDLDHADLQKNLGPENYFKVPAYNFRASFDRIADKYRTALEEAGIQDDNLENDIKFFRSKTQNTVARDAKPPQEDEGIQMMLKAVGMVGGQQRKRLRSTRKRRQRRSKKLMRKN